MEERSESICRHLSSPLLEMKILIITPHRCHQPAAAKDILRSVHVHRHTSISRKILIGHITSICSRRMFNVFKNRLKNELFGIDRSLFVFIITSSSHSKHITLGACAQTHTHFTKNSHWSHHFNLRGKCSTCPKIGSKMNLLASIARFLVAFLQILRGLGLANLIYDEHAHHPQPTRYIAQKSTSRVSGMNGWKPKTYVRPTMR